MRKLNVKGFSLVELMVVVAIIGILSAIAIPNFQRFQRKARQSEAKTMLGGLYTAMETFKAEWEDYTGFFMDIGFAPAGNLRYNVGFGGEGDAVADDTFVQRAGAGQYNSVAACQNDISSCTDNSSGTALNAASTWTNGAGLGADSFIAEAVGDIGGAAEDNWTVTEQKVYANPTDGTL